MEENFVKNSEIRPNKLIFVRIERRESQIHSTIRPQPCCTDFRHDNRQSKPDQLSTQFIQNEEK
ncbi:hypothetical protein T07_8062 [Trichinella nelsoni]|uniref:Uncharacterized protein n=1 Tax=Trichinella nelsoni TaxID=6336 RepID=A0A0V0RHY0_9BILA|nr:hypothetical protein T07_8062 [Trichinella nelsoni]